MFDNVTGLQQVRGPKMSAWAITINGSEEKTCHMQIWLDFIVFNIYTTTSSCEKLLNNVHRKVNWHSLLRTCHSTWQVTNITLVGYNEFVLTFDLIFKRWEVWNIFLDRNIKYFNIRVSYTHLSSHYQSFLRWL